ncbi:COP1-interactive protein 1-like [Pyrus x bretschneideri]|uniref:COP1-interactive protein 1-like n=1 Tax=Pyrus x bretschneideri TaxID=225117 RepID=UPI0020308C7A|nr:COP1-interactive protein 1-like [Pyrus x bretschneideri]
MLLRCSSKPLRKSSVEELTDKHSRALELHSAFEARIVEAKTKLQEAIETFSQRDLEANGISIIVREVLLQREISELKEQLNEQRAREAALISEVQILKDEVAEKPLLQNSLKELQTKSARFEEERRKLAEANIKFKEDVSTCKYKQCDLEAKYSTVVAEKHKSVEQLQAAKRTIEDLTQQHSSQGQKLQSQISSLMDENRLLNEVHQNTKQELQQVISNLDEKLKEQKAGEAALKSEVKYLKVKGAEKPLLQNSLKELQTKLAHCEEESRKLVEANKKLKEDVSTYESKQSELEAKYSTAIAKNDESVEQLQAAKRTIEDLKEQHSSQGQKLQSQISSLMDENRLLNEVHQNTKKELQQNSLKELQTKLARCEEDSRKLAKANKKLKEDVSTYKSKQRDLEAKYSTVIAEKDESVEKLQAAKRTIEDLMQQHSSQRQKLQSQISSFTDENNLLNEVHQNTKKELQLAISNLEEQLKEQKTGEAALKSEVENLKAEAAGKPLLQNSLKELQTKSAHFEEESRKLADANIKLKEDVSTYESKQSDLKAKYSTAVAENDESVEQLQAAKRTIEDLKEQHSSQGQKLQSQISSLTDENSLLNEVHQNTKKELQQAISNLEEQLKEQKTGEAALKSEVENLKAEVAEKPLLQNSLMELQTMSAHCEEDSRKLAKANIKLKEDVSTYECKQSDLEAKYSTAVAEKDESVEQLQAAKRTIEDLMQKHSSQGQKLKSQLHPFATYIFAYR